MLALTLSKCMFRVYGRFVFETGVTVPDFGIIIRITTLSDFSSMSRMVSGATVLTARAG